MPSEVFAEDIEALLERLEGVSAARVVATDAGDIDRIYLTASAAHDPSVVRRMVTTALMSSYSLPLDGWRIRVARLESGEVSHHRWRVHRLEDVRTPTGVKVTVELRAEANADARMLGSAHGLPDPANRLRTAAVATLAALKSSLEVEATRASVESIGTISLAGRETAVVAVSISGANHAELCVGAALVGSSEIEAVIEATLDAVEKRTPGREQRRMAMKDRREQLESMRAHYRQIRGPQRGTPVVAPPPPSELQPAAAADVSTEPAPTELRPERPGGAEVAPREEAARPETDRPRGVSRGAIDDEFFRQLITAGTPIDIRCRDGYQISGAVLKGFGTYTLMVVTKHGDELVFKHGIIAIRAQTKTPSSE